MSAAERLRALADLRWTDEKGRASTFRLTPPPDAAALARLETRLGGALPPDAREVLAVGALDEGIDGPPPARPSWWRTLLGLGAPPPHERHDR